MCDSSFSPNHRNGLATDLERRYNGGKYTTQENCNIEIAFWLSEKEFSKNSSLITLNAATF